MKLPPALEATVLEPHVVSHCPSACCFNRTCPERVQRGMEMLWINGQLTASNYRTGCYRFEYLADQVTKVTGRAEIPDEAEALYELLVERLSFQDPAPPTSMEAQHTDPDAIALRDKIMALRDADRHRREAATKAAYDATHPQQELGV